MSSLTSTLQPTQLQTKTRVFKQSENEATNTIKKVWRIEALYHLVQNLGTNMSRIHAASGIFWANCLRPLRNLAAQPLGVSDAKAGVFAITNLQVMCAMQSAGNHIIRINTQLKLLWQTRRTIDKDSSGKNILSLKLCWFNAMCFNLIFKFANEQHWHRKGLSRTSAVDCNLDPHGTIWCDISMYIFMQYGYQ